MMFLMVVAIACLFASASFGHLYARSAERCIAAQDRLIAAQRAEIDATSVLLGAKDRAIADSEAYEQALRQHIDALKKEASAAREAGWREGMADWRYNAEAAELIDMVDRLINERDMAIGYYEQLEDRVAGLESDRECNRNLASHFQEYTAELIRTVIERDEIIESLEAELDRSISDPTDEFDIADESGDEMLDAWLEAKIDDHDRVAAMVAGDDDLPF